MSNENSNYKSMNRQLAKHSVLLLHCMTAVCALVIDCKK